MAQARRLMLAEYGGKLSLPEWKGSSGLRTPELTVGESDKTQLDASVEMR